MENLATLCDSSWDCKDHVVLSRCRNVHVLAIRGVLSGGDLRL